MRRYYGNATSTVGKVLSDYGFRVDDLITYDSTDESTGGTIYRIVEDKSPVAPTTTQRPAVRNHVAADRRGFSFTTQEEYTEFGAWDDKGRAISKCNQLGYVRIKPIFQFLPTARGAAPKGKSGTLMIYYTMLPELKKVDIVALGVKYAELGNILKDVMRHRGAELNDEPVST